MNGTSRVAQPTHTTRTPLARGSSVPAWPTRLVPAQRTAMSTTRREVMPTGLLRLRRPTMAAGRRGRKVEGVEEVERVTPARRASEGRARIGLHLENRRNVLSRQTFSLARASG